MAKTNFIQNDLLDTGEPLKRCKVCGGLKSLDQFYRAKYGSVCRQCQSKRALEWKKINPERRLALVKQSRYNISIREQGLMIERQNGVCAICKKPETALANGSGKVRSLCVDHNHVTGKVRELLCSECNTMLGKSKDSPEILRAAADYLERHQKLQAKQT